MSGFPQLHQLSPDERPWRIDWFGEIGYPGTVRQYRHPCIKVAISPLLDSPDRFGLAGDHTTDTQHQRNVWAPLGALPRLRIGDLWQAGECVKAPPYTLHSFNLRIASDTTAVVKAGLSIDDDYLLPFSAHPWHRLHTHSYCVTVKTTHGSTLIIPGVELIRFYFGSSSNLLHRLMTQPLREEALWREKHFDATKRHLHIKLVDGLSGVSAADIGRIALDSHAWRAAAGIYGHCIKATSQGETAYPYAVFPFHGATTIVAHGMWLPTGDQANHNFLVFCLRHCSHPFPFDSLTYEAGDRQVQKRASPSEDTSNETPSQLCCKTPHTGAALDDTDPGAGKRTRRIQFDHAYRFSDLKRKPVWRERIQTLGAREILCRHQDGTLEHLAFGEPEGSGNARAIDSCCNESQASIVEANPKELPHFVRVGITMAIAQQPGQTERYLAKPLLLHGMADPVFALPMVVDEDGVVDTETLFVEPDESHRQRRACFIRIFDGDRGIGQAALIEGEDIRAAPAVRAVINLDIIQLLGHMLDPKT